MANMLTSNNLVLQKAREHTTALCVLLLGKKTKNVWQTLIQVSDSPIPSTQKHVVL